MKRPLYPTHHLPATRTWADVATRRLLGLLLLLLVLAACARRYHPRRNAPSWAQRERTLEQAHPNR